VQVEWQQNIVPFEVEVVVLYIDFMSLMGLFQPVLSVITCCFRTMMRMRSKCGWN
jgi:hypothetical protein